MKYQVKGLVFEDGVVYSQDLKTLIRVPVNYQGVLRVKEGVETIGRRALCSCTKVTEVVLPDSVSVIEDGAFCLCESLRHINIPSNAVRIGEFAFMSCVSLRHISIPATTSVGDFAWRGCFDLEVEGWPGSVAQVVAEMCEVRFRSIHPVAAY